MKITSIILALVAMLRQTYADCEVCHTEGPEETYGLLANGPARWRIVLHWGGDSANPDVAGEVETRLIVTVQQAAGLQRVAGKDLVEAVGSREPFYDRLEDTRTTLRSAQFLTPDGQGGWTESELIDCQRIRAGDARPLVLERDGALIPGLRQAEFELILHRALPWSSGPALVTI
jgi:hypothetical protein